MNSIVLKYMGIICDKEMEIKRNLLLSYSTGFTARGLNENLI